MPKAKVFGYFLQNAGIFGRWILQYNDLYGRSKVIYKRIQDRLCIYHLRKVWDFTKFWRSKWFIFDPFRQHSIQDSCMHTHTHTHTHTHWTYSFTHWCGLIWCLTRTMSIQPHLSATDKKTLLRFFQLEGPALGWALKDKEKERKRREGQRKR